MKRNIKLNLVLAALLIVLLGHNTFAQQTPLINHYTVNPFLTNPARAGDNGNNIFAIHRSQWIDVKGAPETFLLTLDGGIPSKKVGLGLTVYNDLVNIIGKTGAMGTYSYKLPLNELSKISFGLSIGVEQNKILFDRVKADNPQEITLINNIDQSLNFDGNFGINYTYKGLNLGAAGYQLFGNQNKIADNINIREYKYSFVRHFLGNLSYEIPLKNETFFLTPFLQMRTAPKIKPQMDFALLANFKKKVWGGLGYRLNYGMNFQAGALLADKLTAGYSYGRSMGNLTKLSANSHEVILGLKLNGGASDGKGDRDKDGVLDYKDSEIETPHWRHIGSEKPFLDASECIVDHNGLTKDSDFDGVPDCVDKELLSPIGAPVDKDGVALDDDKDGVVNLYDREPETPEGCEVDVFGVALDDDKDGVPNCKDRQLKTPFGAPVDEFGVALDSDGDGVPDLYDFEENTPLGCAVNKFGIALDDDMDGVPNCRDLELNTPRGKIVDQNGISGSQAPRGELDSDGDGIPDHLDLQPDSPEGARVDQFGRALVGSGNPTENKIDLKDMIDNDPDWDYYVIVGVFRYWDNVKQYQKHLVQNYFENTKLLITEQNFYYVWTKQVFTVDEAIAEVSRLKDKKIEEYIVGNPWLWKEPKKK